MMIEFTWHRDKKGYNLIPGSSPRIVGKGGSQKLYRPLDEFPTLFKAFGNIQKTPGASSTFSRYLVP